MNNLKPGDLTHGKYIDPLTDFAFKKIFGSDANNDVLIDFLNAVFRGRKLIIDLQIDKNEHPGDIKEERTVIFDLHCTGEEGEKFIIEVQRYKQLNYKDRTLFYGSRLITEQGPKNKRNGWNYELKEVYLVAILDNFTLDDSPAGEYIYDVGLCNLSTGKIFHDKLGYTFIELLKFDKGKDEVTNILDIWLYCLKNLRHLPKEPEFIKDHPIFKKLFEIAEYTKLSKEEKTMYDNSLKNQWDHNAVMGYSRKEGMDEGISIGEKKGIAIGEKKGRHEEAIAIASNLKKKGMDIQAIAEITMLPIREIKKL